MSTQWLAGWHATNEPPWPRRRLKQVPLDLPEELDDTGGGLDMTGTPDGRLVVRHRRPTVRILDRTMRVLQTDAGACDDAACRLDRCRAMTRSSRVASTGRCAAPLTAAQPVAQFQLEGYYSALLSPGVSRQPCAHLAAFSFSVM